MKQLSRRGLITSGIAVTVGATGIALAQRRGLIPPDGTGLYGLGETLTYAGQRLLGGQSLAREFAREQISQPPFANAVDTLGDDFHRLQTGGFTDWRLDIDGLVAQPTSFTLANLKSFPVRSQITHLACEEGWSYIAEWTGVPLSHVLGLAGAHPGARFLIYRSIQPDWWESIDIAEAMHPQTLVTYGMNGGELPVAFGGPLRLRVPRQLGYKSVKYITRITVSDSPRLPKPGSDEDWHGSANRGYAWYAGI